MAGLEDLLALYATETTDRVPGGAVFVRRRDDYVELRQRGATAFAVWVRSGDQPGQPLGLARRRPRQHARDRAR